METDERHGVAVAVLRLEVPGDVTGRAAGLAAGASGETRGLLAGGDTRIVRAWVLVCVPVLALRA
jgi:hypothetical protein